MTGKPPTVSVVLPTYNRADLLARSLRSVLEQSWRDLEVIVVDDGSTDHTAEVVRSCGDPRVRYVERRENAGAAVARNTGIEAAAGRFIAFQDSDDVWHPEALEKRMQAFADAPADTGVVYCGFWRTQDGRKRYIPARHIEPRDGEVLGSLLRGNFVSTQTAVVRRACFERVGPFDADLPPLEDWDFFLRVAAHYAFRLVDEALVESLVLEDSISASRPNYLAAYEGILRKHRARIDATPGLLPLHYATIGNYYCHGGQMREGRRRLAQAARRAPGRWEYAAAWLASLLGRRAYVRLHTLLRRRRYDPEYADTGPSIFGPPASEPRRTSPEQTAGGGDP